MCDSWEPCCFSLCDPGRLRGMTEPLSARGRDRDLIRPSVCGDQGARVNQRQTDPSSPWGFTRLDPDTLSLSLSHKGTHTATVTKAHILFHTHTHTLSSILQSSCHNLCTRTLHLITVTVDQTATATLSKRQNPFLLLEIILPKISSPQRSVIVISG